MSIRNKLIVLFVGGILAVILIVASISSWQLKQYALVSYQKEATLDVARVNSIFQQYTDSAKMFARHIANTRVLKESMGKNQRYTNTQTKTELLYENHTPFEQEIYAAFMNIKEMDDKFGLIFMGNPDGGFMQAPEKDVISPGFDPRKRPWYVGAMENPEDINVSSVYVSTSGDLVTSISSKIYDNTNTFIGVVAIDVNLDTLASYIDALEIGKTGYALVLDKNNNVLMNPKDNSANPQTLMKPLSDSVLPEFAEMLSSPSGNFETESNGEKVFVAFQTSEATGWKIGLVITAKEVNELANNMILMMVGLAAVMLAIAIVVSVLIARNIANPIRDIVGYVGGVSGGNLDAMPSDLQYSGEVGLLYKDLRSMIAQLAKLVHESEEKTQEAEAQTQKASEALKLAAEAQTQADHARKEGLLQAAADLKDVVFGIRSSVQNMTEQIEGAGKDAEQQNRFASETTNAMGDMNSAVREVARSSGLASETARDTTQRASDGASTVSTVRNAINDVNAKTEQLRDMINALGGQAQNVGQVMTVIADIADQTNLLALNAAIEAARAGDAGRGFAVVADEVRKLAENTMQATSQVESVVRTIQKGTEDSIVGMEETSNSVHQALDYAATAEEALQEIVELSESTDNQIHSIATASEEQSQVAESVRHSASNISELSQTTVESMDNARAGVEQLEGLAERLEAIFSGLQKQGESND